MTRGRVLQGTLVFFAAGAALGAAFALVGPVAFIRVLGLVAFACAVGGCGLHLAVLRRVDPRTYRALVGRLFGRPRAPNVEVLNSIVYAPRRA
jgi:hypothetical protein